MELLWRHRLAALRLGVEFIFPLGRPRVPRPPGIDLAAKRVLLVRVHVRGQLLQLPAFLVG